MLRQLKTSIVIPLEIIRQPSNLLLHLGPRRRLIVTRRELLSEAKLARPVERVDLALLSRSSEHHLHAQAALVDLFH